MQISKFSDYAFRALVYLANHSNKLCTVEELSEQLQTSPHHMKKVVHKLASSDYIISLKGRTGGLRLGRAPEKINLGEVLTFTEENLNMFECFSNSNCPLIFGGCKLKAISQTALSKFIDEFSAYSLADIL
jgi:Rrf2 family nitric oxide-sensitive transcriptional repressor